MVLQEYHNCSRLMVKYFNIVKTEMARMNQADPEKAKVITAAIQQLTQRMVSRAPGAQEVAAPQQQQQQQPALNANNLQRHAEQLAEQHRLTQKAGRMSPDGSPPIVIKPSVTRDDLKLPNRKRKLTDQPENPSPSKTRSPKPAATTTPVFASPQSKARPAPPVEKKFKCERAGCPDAFALSNELAEHQRMHERNAERQRLEGEKATFRKENPLEYSLSSIASACPRRRPSLAPRLSLPARHLSGTP
jgi:hypothetical protein